MLRPPGCAGGLHGFHPGMLPQLGSVAALLLRGAGAWALGEEELWPWPWPCCPTARYFWPFAHRSLAVLWFSSRWWVVMHGGVNLPWSLFTFQLTVYVKSVLHPFLLFPGSEVGIVTFNWAKLVMCLCSIFLSSLLENQKNSNPKCFAKT